MTSFVKESENAAYFVSQSLKAGGVAVVPTETVYGLICDACNSGAIQSVYAVKNRLLSKPLSLFVSNIEVILDNAINLSSEQVEFVVNNMPGPVTVIVKMSESCSFVKGLSELVGVKSGQCRLIGFRIPQYEFCMQVLDYFKRPIVATSVNFSGESPAVKLRDIDQQIINHLTVCVGAKDEKCLSGKPSTVYDFTNSTSVILRT